MSECTQTLPWRSPGACRQNTGCPNMASTPRCTRRRPGALCCRRVTCHRALSMDGGDGFLAALLGLLLEEVLPAKERWAWMVRRGKQNLQNFPITWKVDRTFVSSNYDQITVSTVMLYCNRRNFRTRFNFVFFFILLAESIKFYSIRKLYSYTRVCDKALAVRNFIAYESPRTLEYEIFTRTKISAIAVHLFRTLSRNFRSVANWILLLLAEFKFSSSAIFFRDAQKICHQNFGRSLSFGGVNGKGEVETKRHS